MTQPVRVLLHPQLGSVLGVNPIFSIGRRHSVNALNEIVNGADGA